MSILNGDKTVTDIPMSDIFITPGSTNDLPLMVVIVILIILASIIGIIVLTTYIVTDRMN